MQLVRPHAPRLQFAYLGGCHTDLLGRALFEQAQVRCVVCFSSRVLDKAVALFGRAFAATLANRGDPREAFQAAATEVLTQTERGALDNGMIGHVQKYEFRSPDDPAVHRCSPTADGRCPCTGSCPSRCPWRGRLLPVAGQKVRQGWRGRLAVGLPQLLVR